MAQAKTWAAFDVHVSGVVAATLDRESGELRVQRLPGRSEEVAAFAAGLPGPVRATYEAGPTGFVLARKLEAIGVDCLVCAPGLIPRGASDRVKTDRRDAERLVRLLSAGELHRVAVPSVEEEALRDLVRAREDLRGDLMRARHRLAKLLLRHEIRFEGTQANWTQAHLGWLAGVTLQQPASQRALEDYRGGVSALLIRREQLEAEIARALPCSPWAQTARRLMCLRGIDTLTAAGLCAEIGDFHRFEHPAQVMSYLGVVPSEHSSGERRRRGPITKSGSQRADCFLAWEYCAGYVAAARRHSRQRRRGMLLATTQVEDFDRFLKIFSTKGAEKRKEHGSKGSIVFRDPNEEDRVWVVFDWDAEGWQSFVSDPEVPPILQEAGHKGKPQALELGGQYDA